MAFLTRTQFLRGAGCVGALAVLLSLAPAVASGAEASLEYAVKAAYLYKFAPFVDWPANAFAGPSAPFAVCVFGQDPFGRLLDDAVRGQSVGGRRIVVRRPAAIQDAQSCQVLYLGRSGRTSVAESLRLLRGRPILTVTEEGGGVVQFVLRDGRVRFAVDAERARQNGLGLSSKLLALAVSVRRSD
jgi:hypothetical protein